MSAPLKWKRSESAFLYPPFPSSLVSVPALTSGPTNCTSLSVGVVALGALYCQKSPPFEESVASLTMGLEYLETYRADGQPLEDDDEVIPALGLVIPKVTPLPLPSLQASPPIN
jgi:hypothetical protein